METQSLSESTEPRDYFDAPGLSNSGMSDLAVSPYRYWFLHVNPDRKPKEETPAMVFGSALHMAVLEPERFPERYCCEIDASDYPGCLVTMDDLRGWLKDHGITPKGTRKADVAAQVAANSDPCPPILDWIRERHATENAGKIELSKDFWYRIGNAAIALRREPEIAKILSDGDAEVALTAIDPETGVLLKGKLDWMSDACTLDLKSFSQQRGKSIDKTIADAIWYEDYARQAYFYCLLRSLQPNSGMKTPGQAPPFILAFVESEEPHEVRLREIRAKHLGQPSLLWERARIQVREHIRTFAECSAYYGTSPWRSAQPVAELLDEDISQLAFS